MQPPLRVEHVAEPEQVVLVGAAPVVEHEQAGRVPGGRPLAIGQRAHAGHPRARVLHGGERPLQPLAQVLVLRGQPERLPEVRRVLVDREPGESVAISNSTPRGSRK